MVSPTRLRRVAFVFLIAIVTLAVRRSGTAAQRGLNQVDGAPTGPRTGLIVGQVVDSTGAPIPEAIVYMSLPKFFADLPTTPKGLVMADSEGRFFFSDLPAGDYFLRASKEGYGGGQYGQRRVTGNGRLYAVAEGERRADAKLTLWKHAVIGGTVVDEAGEPVIGVAVQALVKTVVAGRTKYGSGYEEGMVNPTATTDDRGMFRLSQLNPAQYVIVVPSTQTTVPTSLLNMSSQDTAFRTEIFRAIDETAPLGTPRTLQVGEFALLTLNRVLIPPAPSAAGRMEVYKTTYFPAATTAGAATPIRVDGGEERTDLRIALRPVPAVKISGRLVTPDGTAPAPTSLRLVGEATADVGEAGFETVTGMSDASGRFTLLGVPAGRYVLKQASMLALFGLQGRAGWWVAQPVTVSGDDISDLVVRLRPALQVAGRFEFRGVTPSPPAAQNRVSIGFQTPLDEPGRFAGQTSGRADGTFATIAAGGQFIARPSEDGGWFVKSVTLDGKDITDRVFDLQADATTIVVAYTDVASKVTGIVKDASGAASPTAVVLAFPVNPQYWTGQGSRPRNLKSTFVSRTGAYSLEGLPPGDYFLVAIDDADSDGWTDPKTLEALSRLATRLTVFNVEAKTVDLTVKGIR